MSPLKLITVLVDDYDAGIEFFCTSCRFDLTEDSPATTDDGRPKRWVVVTPPGGGTSVLLARADGEAQAARVGAQLGGRVGFFLEVDDFDQQHRHMLDHGVTFLEAPRSEPYGRVAVFVDIAGNHWDLLGTPPQPASSTEIVMQPIATVVGGRTEAVDDDWAREEAVIRLADHLPTDTLAGLETFSHLEVVFHFHGVDPDTVNLGTRHPRNRSDWPAVGIFAQRAKARPNRIGVTTCDLVRVEGRDLTVRGLDAIHGTPVLDIKPHVVEFGPRGTVRQPDWMTELMRKYW